MSRAPDDRPIVDWSTAACLAGGWHAALAVHPDGQTRPWLLDPDTGDVDGEGHGGCAEVCCAPHERLGRLPVDIRVRIHQCAAIIRSTRRQCRRPAPLGERFCAQHIAEDESEEASA